MDNIILNICKKDKPYLSKFKILERTFKKYIELNKLKFKENHLKYIFTKYKGICYPSNIEEIFDFCNYVEELGYLCRSVTKCNILDEKNYVIEHSHIILFTELSIKILIIGENILIDGNFTYLKNFYQAIIIMYYEDILFKMIPDIFIGFNNKALQGYK